jgi:hypothetical protein
MRRAPRPAITAQMYRHFATMTVAMTALIAFFANGEKQTVVAAETTASRPAPAKKPALPPPPSPASDDGGRWGSDDGGDFGHPMASWAAPTLVPAVAKLADGDEDDPDAAGDTDTAFPVPTAAQIAAADAASRQRSGTPTTGD